MKELKFNFWSGTKMFAMKNKPVEVVVCLSQQLLYNQGELGYDHIGEHGAAFLQSTGLEDNNQHEIFEGDVVKMHGGICQIKFDGLAFVAEKIVAKGDDARGWQIQPHLWADVKIIGNIYENPELLI